MQVNFLEELVAEWLEYKSYFVKRNERVGRRKAGGYEVELDVVGFNPKTRHLIHIETSGDARSWANRENQFSKKFSSANEKYIRLLFDGLDLPPKIEKQVIFVSGSNKNYKTVGGGKVVPLKNFILNILSELKQIPFMSRAVPEKYPMLRLLQTITYLRKEVVGVLQKQ